jgi:hypothetical protein
MVDYSRSRFLKGDIIQVSKLSPDRLLLAVGKAQQTMEWAGGWAQFQITLSDGSERTFNINTVDVTVLYTDYREPDQADLTFSELADEYPSIQALDSEATLAIIQALRDSASGLA